VEEIVRGFPEIAEYQVTVSSAKPLAEMKIEIEPASTCANPQALAEALQRKLETAWSLRVPVSSVTPGCLPRYELKARRWIKV
jgi:phenylacetate-CoA ligase